MAYVDDNDDGGGCDCDDWPIAVVFLIYISRGSSHQYCGDVVGHDSNDRCAYGHIVIVALTIIAGIYSYNSLYN